MNNSVRKITDGAMMCAIVGLLLVVNRQFAGMLEEMFLFFFSEKGHPAEIYSCKMSFS